MTPLDCLTPKIRGR